MVRWMSSISRLARSATRAFIHSPIASMSRALSTLSPWGLISPFFTLTTAIWSISMRLCRFSASTRKTKAPFSRTRK